MKQLVKANIIILVVLLLLVFLSSSCKVQECVDTDVVEKYAIEQTKYYTVPYPVYKQECHYK